MALRPTWDSAGSVVVPAWPCTGWGLPGRRVATPPVRSYRTISPLPAARARASPPLRRCVSVALSRGSPRVGSPDHPALRCPDFPRGPVFSPASRGCLASPTRVGSRASEVHLRIPTGPTSGRTPDVPQVVIDSRFNGPPDSANGGYTCGLVAAAIDGPAE